ncbi:transcriptional regulator [Sphaerisporangium siamense]|uniref:Transcriptional regulator with XRE-family HTH domain n=1 Tax=Sphaerisporangium siamense TaxID=795645 RepID=A0A7W7D9B7_9ACTN|nr:helix-turn-helix transcriptional regulator [Sphaerisporangium siamense]MBB4701346.1 transcriptional regulator with XRE-family HTH domain [Sphaerisporangium siamense]GII87285.1 transcriptional regulator [Sphaerisporangium siamense]
MSNDVTIGARLRTLRRWRGMTLAQLAGQVGLSPSFLSMAERGERLLDRRSHISALAAALNVSEIELTGTPQMGRDAAQTAPRSAIPLLRAALTGNSLDDPAAETGRPLPVLDAFLFGELADMRNSADYERRARLVAPVIDELHWHAATGDERSRRHALRLLVEACNAAGMTLKHLGNQDLAYVAVARASDAALLLDDPVATAHSAYLRVMIMPKPRGWGRPYSIASKAADALEAHVRPGTAAELYGMLHLTAALSAAAVHRPDLADDHLAEARDVAARTGESPRAFAAFGPANVGVWSLAVAMEYGDYQRAIEMSSNVMPDVMPNRERIATFHADKGRALAHLKRGLPAVTELKAAERIAPQRVRNSTAVQETVQHLLGQQLPTTLTRELRGMAARMGIPH